MILKKQEKDNLIKAMYSSSNILASIYDKEKNDLTLIFNKGSQYKYPGVSNTDYTRFEIAESQGAVFNTHIKKYAFEKLADIDPALILKDIETMKAAEQKAFLKAKQQIIVRTMKSLLLVDDAVGVDPFTEEQLAVLQTNIIDYLVEYKK